MGHWLGVVVGKNWVLSVDQCWMEALQFLVHFINLLSMLLRGNGFAGIQKAVVDQASSRQPNSDHDLFLVQVQLWEVHWSFFLVQPLSWSSLIIILKNPLFITHYIQSRNGLLLLCRIKEDNISKGWFFWFAVSFFTFPVCLKCWTTVK